MHQRHSQSLNNLFEPFRDGRGVSVVYVGVCVLATLAVACSFDAAAAL